MNLQTKTKITWCPGCTNFGILAAFKGAIEDLLKTNELKKEEIVIGSGVGCASKIADYLNLNSFDGLHGRVLPLMSGVKIANPKLRIITFAGDGESYAEGIEHLVHAAKRNIDITVLVHDNRNFALTTGQFTATSPKGFKGPSTPEGSQEEPFDPLKIMLASGATFIAQGYSAKTDHLKNLIKQGILHKGFSFIDILQPCMTYSPKAYQLYNERIFEAEPQNLTSEKEALKKINQWKFGEEIKIPIGIFYKIQKPVYKIRNYD